MNPESLLKTGERFRTSRNDKIKERVVRIAQFGYHIIGEEKGKGPDFHNNFFDILFADIQKIMINEDLGTYGLL